MEVRRAGIFLLVIFVTPLLTPTVIADWDDDNWLWNLIGPERLEHGDEFACHGYEGENINNDSFDDWSDSILVEMSRSKGM